jgi:hypothetical protein
MRTGKCYYLWGKMLSLWALLISILRFTCCRMHITNASCAYPYAVGLSRSLGTSFMRRRTVLTAAAHSVTPFWTRAFSESNVWALLTITAQTLYEGVSKISGLAAWSENCKWYSSLPLGAVISLFYESV